MPIIEQCPYDPFGNLPPEFQQFFGNDTQNLTQPCDTGKTQLQEVGGGSGFIISTDGLVLTNKHVVADTKASYTVITNDGKKYDAKVQPDSPAAKAGVHAEDIILKINNQKLDKDHFLGDVISQYNVGDVIALTIDRAGKEITLQATLTKRPAGQ